MLTIARIRMPENSEFHCRLADAMSMTPGEKCLVELDYGLDYGVVLDLTAHQESAPANSRMPGFRVVRRLSEDEASQIAKNAVLAEKAMQAFALSVAHEKGHVKLLHTRFSYGRNRLFIRYSAQVPVDLRRFVAQLQRDYKTHVDLWQVGVRDETALLGCLGVCGRAACCCTWQHQFDPVNVTMGKCQEMSLNPVTLNGTCGRLKCCLRFEYEQYREAGAHLPLVHTPVICNGQDPLVTGVVVARDVLRGYLTVRTRDGRYVTVPHDEVSVQQHHEKHVEDESKEIQEDENTGDEWSESESARDT